MRADGSPFFYLADTAWELFHKLGRADAETFLQNRADKGFTVVQAVVLAELDGLKTPNAQGHTPLHNLDPTKPDDGYFEDVDWIVGRARALGLTIGMLPTWGDKWNLGWGVGPLVFTPENALVYGRFLGQRYRDAPVVWIVGGDRAIENETQRAIVENMALGLREGDAGAHLITFHPRGGETSSRYFHNAPWLDFNMWQTGHARDRDNYHSISQDYALAPPKPCTDGEPGYEDHPSAFDPKNGYLDETDVRRSIYWALFAGAHGHTYGCHPIWQFVDDVEKGKSWPRRDWREALDLPGSAQMQHAKNLMLSRPFFERVPDQSLILEGEKSPDFTSATRDENGTYAFVYCAAGASVKVDGRRLEAAKLRAWWFDPRDGKSQNLGEFAVDEARVWTPPSSGRGHDWVLVLDDVARHYPEPGALWKGNTV